MNFSLLHSRFFFHNILSCFGPIIILELGNNMPCTQMSSDKIHIRTRSHVFFFGVVVNTHTGIYHVPVGLALRASRIPLTEDRGR